MNTVPVSNAIADTFAAHLDALAAADPARALLIDPDGAVSAAELRARAVALAAGLARLGLQPGQRVAIWLPNCAAWVESFLACARLGAGAGGQHSFPRAGSGRHPGARQGRLADLLAGLQGIDFQGVLDDVPAEALARLRGVIAIDAPDAAAAGLTAPEASAATGDRHALPRHRYADLRACADAPPPAQANTGVLCFTTSGTTSRPKFVLHDQRTLLAHGAAVARAFAYGRPPALASAPFCGAFGFSTLVSGLAQGAPVVCSPVFDAAASAREIREHAITHTYANNEALTGASCARRARRPGIGAAVRLRQLHPGAGRHAGPGAAAGRCR